MDTYYDYEVEAAYMPSDKDYRDLETEVSSVYRQTACEYDWRVDAPEGWACCVKCGERYPYGTCRV